MIARKERLQLSSTPEARRRQSGFSRGIVQRPRPEPYCGKLGRDNYESDVFVSDFADRFRVFETSEGKRYSAKLYTPAGQQISSGNRQWARDQERNSDKRLDPKSVAIGAGYITFNQSFKTYDNSWRINRNALKVSIKAVLKDNRRVVLDEKASCANSLLSRQVRAKPVSNPAAARNSMRLR